MEEVYIEEEVNLLDSIRVLKKRLRLIVGMFVFAMVVSIVVSLLLPNIYASTAQIMPPLQDNKMGVLSKLSSGMAGLAGGLLGGENSTADLWIGILKSRTVADTIIKRFNLRALYETETTEATRGKLEKAVTIKKSDAEIVSITVENEVPERAAQMASAFVEALDEINRNIVVTSGKRMRVFIEKRMEGANQELARSEEAIKNFQQRTRAVKLNDQSKAIITAIGDMKTILMAKEVELQTMLSYATPANPEVELLRTHVKELKTKLKELEEGNGGTPGENLSTGIFIPTTEFPDLNLKYARLLREMKMQQSLYELLTQQYEMAKIQEAKDTPTIQILDIPKVAEERSKPKRTLIVILSSMISGSMAVFLAFFLEYVEKIKEEQNANECKTD